MILHSPTERGTVIRVLTSLANAPNKKKQRVEVKSSGIVEPMGVDFGWYVEELDEWRGVQRKELKDFLASIDDGRLAREIAQMNSHIVMPLLVLEGRITTANGAVTIGRYPAIPLGSFYKRLFTIANRGVQVVFANEPAGTAEMIFAYYQWSMSPSHETASTRPKPSGDWGTPTSRDWQIHMLQGLDGVGTKTANAILDTLGRCPLKVDATVQELVQVPGIGAVTARKIIHSINGKV